MQRKANQPLDGFIYSPIYSFAENVDENYTDITAARKIIIIVPQKKQASHVAVSASVKRMRKQLYEL
jgi:hypothetical protein